MAGRRSAARMQLVEVDESPAPPTALAGHDNAVVPPSDAVSVARPTLAGVARRWWPLAAVVVVAVAGAVVVGVARDRAFVARIDAVPGLVHPLGAAPTVRWQAPAAPHGGAVVAAGDALVLVSAQSERWRVTAHAVSDGAVRWSLDVAPVQRSGFESSVVSCPSSGEDVGSTVLCLVTEPRVVYSDDASIDEPAHTRVVALDAARGTELGTWEVTDELIAADRVGDDLVVVTLDREGHAVAERRAGRTGEVDWTFRTPEVLESAVLSRSVDAWTARGVVAVKGFVTYVLDADDGETLVVGAPYRNLEVVALDDGFATWALVGAGHVHAPDGTERFAVAGLPARVRLDDGTADDVLVVDDGGRLQGFSSASGEALWSTETMLDARVRVSDRVLVSGLTRFGVLDPHDGRLLWVSDAGDPVPWQPLSDGALVLAPAFTPDGRPQLAGLGLDDGVRFWAVDLPTGVQGVDGVGGLLVVRTADEAVVLG